ncbi:unnamed protein product [Chrysoparadoxa australica]
MSDPAPLSRKQSWSQGGGMGHDQGPINMMGVPPPGSNRMMRGYSPVSAYQQQQEQQFQQQQQHHNYMQQGQMQQLMNYHHQQQQQGQMQQQQQHHQQQHHHHQQQHLQGMHPPHMNLQQQQQQQQQPQQHVNYQMQAQQGMPLRRMSKSSSGEGRARLLQQQSARAMGHPLGQGQVQLPGGQIEQDDDDEREWRRVPSTHIQHVKSCRSQYKQWASEMRGRWFPQEVEYFEYIYELFHLGLLQDVDTGTAFREFMADLLQCDMMRISKKFTGDMRIGHLRYPRKPHKKLSLEEFTRTCHKLGEVESKYLRRRAACRPRKRQRSDPKALEIADPPRDRPEYTAALRADGADDSNSQVMYQMAAAHASTVNASGPTRGDYVAQVQGVDSVQGQDQSDGHGPMRTPRDRDEAETGQALLSLFKAPPLQRAPAGDLSAQAASQAPPQTPAGEGAAEAGQSQGKTLEAGSQTAGPVCTMVDIISASSPPLLKGAPVSSSSSATTTPVPPAAAGSTEATAAAGPDSEAVQPNVNQQGEATGGGKQGEGKAEEGKSESGSESGVGEVGESKGRDGGEQEGGDGKESPKAKGEAEPEAPSAPLSSRSGGTNQGPHSSGPPQYATGGASGMPPEHMHMHGNGAGNGYPSSMGAPPHPSSMGAPPHDQPGIPHGNGSWQNQGQGQPLRQTPAPLGQSLSTMHGSTASYENAGNRAVLEGAKEVSRHHQQQQPFMPHPGLGPEEQGIAPSAARGGSSDREAIKCNLHNNFFSNPGKDYNALLERLASDISNGCYSAVDAGNYLRKLFTDLNQQMKGQMS